jgi:hypothetical protein
MERKAKHMLKELIGIQSIVYSILWIILGTALLHATLFLSICCNLFSWNPELNWVTVFSACAVVVCLVCIVWLSKKTNTFTPIAISLLTCVSLNAYGTYEFKAFHSETLSSGFLGRMELSPEWFRVTILLILLSPSISWFCYPFRSLKKLIKTTNP